MSRTSQEPYKQDRLGNVNREIDTVRGQDGMSAAGEANGLIEVTDYADGSAEDNVTHAVFTVDEDIHRVYLTEFHIFNQGNEEGTITIYEDTDAGTVQRSLPVTVAAGAQETVNYSGREFTGDIMVQTTVDGMYGAAVITDHPEYIEPASEQQS